MTDNINQCVELISIGDELLIGQTINSNAAWIGENLLIIGFQMRWVTTVGDDAADLLQALGIAESRASVILLTGGLGPTHDDITKKIATRYFTTRLVLNQKVLDNVRELFRRRGIPMPKLNEEQALVPEAAELIENDQGTAPGFIFKKGAKKFYVMPGVPSEMKSMMTRIVLPELERSNAEHVLLRKTLCTTGIPESALIEKIGNVEEIEKFARIAFLPSLQGVKIRLIAGATTRPEAQRHLDRADQLIRKNIEADIYDEEDVPLELTVARLLKQKNLRVAVAESCTGGYIAHRLTNISGSSEYFDRGIVSYSNAAKTEMLQVPEALIQHHGAVSAQVACAMAEEIRRLAQVDYGLSSTGIAGPTGGTPEKPVGLVYIAVADRNGVVFEKHLFANDRIGNKERSSQAALNLLRKRILQAKD